MKALITAAGLGSRMGHLTKNNNKCALKVNGTPLIVRLVNSLKSSGIDDIFVIVGYQSDKIINLFDDEVTFLFNNEYETTGILDSIMKAKNFMINNEFLVVTGDSIMHPNIFKEIIKSKSDISVSVERKKCDKEDVKVIISDGKFVKISKDIRLDLSHGEFTGLIKVNKFASKTFFDLIKDEFYKPKLIADLIMIMNHKNFLVEPIFTNGLPRLEIDFEYDLDNANEIF
tara:strand:- start:1130 stop:1816 length:687 start_codon:yes stop_codon:yes gene_type:complete